MTAETVNSTEVLAIIAGAIAEHPMTATVRESLVDRIVNALEAESVSAQEFLNISLDIDL